MTSSRSWVLVILAILAGIDPAWGQTAPPAPSAGAAPPAPAEPGPSRIIYGVRFGPSFTTLTSVETFDSTAAPAAFEPTMNFGGFVNIGLTASLSFQPEVLFAAKGERIRDKDAELITTPSGELELPDADRVILVRYLEFPLLLRLSKQTHENTSLFVIAGPAIAFQRNAVIRQVVDSGRNEDIADEVNSGDMSYIFGGGLQHRRWLVDARITRGIRNIASDPVPASVKTGAFAVLIGARF